MNRRVSLEADILEKNNRLAGKNREYFAAHSILSLNLLSSPGSGKTTLLVETIRALMKDKAQIRVIEGDQASELDADRIRDTGVRALQINTGKGCHLDAHMVAHAVQELDLSPGSLLFIENVGNLVCPALFDLGETFRVVLLSVTEGEDKPLKYPHMFLGADVVLLNKIDLLPYLRFRVDRLKESLERVRPGSVILPVSAQTGEGMDAWIEWVRSREPSVPIPMIPD